MKLNQSLVGRVLIASTLSLTLVCFQNCAGGNLGSMQTNGSQAVTLGIDPNLGTEITSLFTSLFGRAPTTAEMNTYTTALTNGTTLAQIRADLIATPEETADVNAVVLAVEGHADANSSALLLGLLQAGATLSSLAASL
jgi:hypothetical protein